MCSRSGPLSMSGAAPLLSPSLDAMHRDQRGTESPGLWQQHGDSPTDATLQLVELVRDFAHTLAQLKDVLQLHDVGVRHEALQERLAQMLLSLELVIGHYPSLNPNNSLLETAALLVNMVHGLGAQDESTEKPRRFSEIFRELDAFEISFGNSTVDLFLTEAEGSLTSPEQSPEGESPVNEDSFPGCHDHKMEERDEFQTSPEEADAMLMKCMDGVESALSYAKHWTKYTKDLLLWMDKRTCAEIEFSKSIMKMAEASKSSINQEKSMPFQYTYTMALQHDIQQGDKSIKTMSLLQHNRYIQPLMKVKNELEKQRREFKEQWQKELRRMNDSLTGLRKSRHMYFQRSEEFEKAKQQSTKAEEDQLSLSMGGNNPGSASKTLERRRRSKDEAQMKVHEAEIHYKNCVYEANFRRNELEKIKVDIITQLRKLICSGDNILKVVSMNMFQMKQEQIQEVPRSMQSLHENLQLYQPAQKYFEFIQNLDKNAQSTESYEFEEFATPSRRSSPAGRRKSGHRTSASSSDFPNVPDEFDNKLMFHNTSGTKPGLSDSESTGASSETRSLDSPISSPAHFGRKLPKATMPGMSPDEYEERDVTQLQDNDLADLNETSRTPATFKNILLSKAAQTHRFRKLRAPTKCRECDGLVVVNGAECEECYLACHRKCLESIAILCGHRKLQTRITLFGVDFGLAPRETPDEVPFIIRNCTSEIERRALSVQGIYRMNGSKIRIAKLRQSFENGRDLTDMSENSPHDITNLVNLYLRELPEPIVLFRLYDDFMKFAKELQQGCDELKDSQSKGIPVATDKVSQLVQQAKTLLHNLPASHYNTLEHIIRHLHRVAERCEENKMTSNNLGIIFGPTLIRPQAQDDTVSMTSLVNSGYQAQVVDFLITQCSQIFEPKQGPSSWTPATRNSPTEPGVNRAGEVLSSAKGRSQSSESLVLKRHSSEGYVSDKSSSNEALDDTHDQRRVSSDSCDVACVADDARSLDGQDSDGGGGGGGVGGTDSLLRCNFNRQPGKYQRYGQAKTRAVIPRPSALPIITANMPATVECPETAGVDTVPGGADTERRPKATTGSSSRSTSPDGGGGTLRRTCGKHKRFELTVGAARLVSKLQERRRVESTGSAVGPATPEGGQSLPGDLESQRTAAPKRSLPGDLETQRTAAPNHSLPGDLETQRTAAPNRSLPGDLETQRTAAPNHSLPGDLETQRTAAPNHPPQGSLETQRTAAPNHSLPGDLETQRTAAPNHPPQGSLETERTAAPNRSLPGDLETQRTVAPNHSLPGDLETEHTAAPNHGLQENLETERTVPSNHSPQGSLETEPSPHAAAASGAGERAGSLETERRQDYREVAVRGGAEAGPAVVADHTDGDLNTNQSNNVSSEQRDVEKMLLLLRQRQSLEGREAYFV
ncbi:GEM-interacting protein isoform X2 [Rhinoraja longicauda]